jgi:hypothetical protein
VLPAGALACPDYASGVSDARGADETANDDEPAGDADTDAEGLEGGPARCDGDRSRFSRRDVGNRRPAEGQLLGLCGSCVPARGERPADQLLIE